jgi:TusA-related sulfurtransferase
MKIARIAALFLFAGIAITARADEAKPAMADKPTFHASKTSTVTSKVKSVNQKTRMVTLVNDSGEEVTFKADKRIKNLKQLKKGDVVTATVTETLSARVLNPGETPTAAASGSTVASAPLGAKPAGYAAKEVYVVATIAAIDKDNMIVTLKNAQGEAFPVKAREKKNVEKLAVGDNIEIHATQSLAVEVTTPKKK